MDKALHLMSALQLRSFCDSSRELRTYLVGMSAEDVKKNTEYILNSATINQIPENGQVELNINSKGEAVIPITGMLTNKVSPSAAFESESVTTYNFITESVRLAELNPNAKSILFDPVSSGGGQTVGMEQSILAIKNATKPTKAIVHANAESAAYMVVSGVNTISAAGKMSMFGSIGVAAEFKDRSESEAKNGVKSIILTSTDAPEKRLDIKTDKGQKATIKLMDELHSVVVGYISEGRNVTPDFINKNFGRGGTMTAERALAVGMIDEIEGVTTIKTNSGPALIASADNAGNVSGNSKIEEKMDEKKFLAFLETNPEAAAYFTTVTASHGQAIADLEASHKTEIETAKIEASTAIKGNQISKLDANFVGNILASSKYGQPVKKCAIEVFTGETKMEMFKVLVGTADEMKAQLDLAMVKKNQPKDLKGEDGHDLETATSLESPAIAADIKELQEKMGVSN